MMTSKERVHAALRREPEDRVPIFMWFHPAADFIVALAWAGMARYDADWL